MECIIEGSSTVLGILGEPKQHERGTRLLKYCLPVQTDDGVLLYNLLTRQLLRLTAAEYAAALSDDYLRKHWFTVPEELDDRELVELVRWVRNSLREKPKHITGYTILTTTDCNARCFYCYERGCKQVSMSQETADKVVTYIKNNCGGEKVKLHWFGGEPLMNHPVIDRISEGLRAQGVNFEASMISNGYLFNDALTAKAVECWKLKNVQITLDGTEQTYNRIKAYVYRSGSAYQVVMENIARLLNAGIRVVIRLNMGPENAQDLLRLARLLAERFEGQTLLHVYAHFLFDTQNDGKKSHSREVQTSLYQAKKELDAYLRAHGMATNMYQLTEELPLSYCMADSGSSVVIVPDGHLGLCQHYTDSEFFGHIDSKEYDKAMIESWRERAEAIEACTDCFYFPECRYLKKCADRSPCCELEREALRYEIEQAMLSRYQNWCSCRQEQERP